jgi:hypothetical protein
MLKGTRIAILFFLVLRSWPVQGGVQIGLKACNNQFGRSWVMTPGAEMALAWKWFSLGLDGTFAAYTPSDALQDYQIQTRISFYPMLRLPFRSLFAEAGYGVARTFTRDEIWTGESGYRFVSSETFHGEWRADAGCAIPMGDGYQVVLKGGLAYQNNANRFFFASMGVGFGSQKHPATKIQPPGPLTDAGIAGSAEPPIRSVLKNVTLIGGTSNISTELNSAIETALIRSGIQVTSWEKIRTTVEEHFQNQAKAANPKANFTSLFTDSLNNLETAFYGSKLMPLDAVIETGIRYVYKAYGEDIIVQSAYAKIIDPVSGGIGWAAEYAAPDPAFSACKQKMIGDILGAIREYKNPKKP